ncbi:MAG: hypothetical protein GF375_04355 [Candidatus Omnitrophica bacterium]|nr:hypothetical protein [Candidatus Omnitrophota bacterium]
MVDRRPEFKNVVLHVCPDAEQAYQESIEEQAEKGLPPRLYAHTMHHPNTVCCSSMMVELSEENRQGIFIHEFGHLFCQRHPYYEGMDNPLDNYDDGDADYVVTEIFKVNLHYDDNEIEEVVLPIGSEPFDDDEGENEEVIIPEQMTLEEEEAIADAIDLEPEDE